VVGATGNVSTSVLRSLEREPAVDSIVAIARRRHAPLLPLRSAAGVALRLRLQPADAGWIDLAQGVPLLETRRAREELGWPPARGAGLDTPPLSPSTGGSRRVRELAGRVGGTEVL
jgi:hypothetical protein